MKRSRFDLSYPVQATFDAGYLVPFFIQDTLPNDTFYISQKSFIRANPMTAPLLHDVDVFLQYWYCPERILWEDTENFFLGLNEQEGKPSPVRPYVVAPEGGFAVGSLADYFGFPTGQAGIKVSAIPFRAYALTYNLKYRHQLYMSEVGIAVASGLDSETNTDLLSPRWRSDYFMQGEDIPQLGEEIQVPVSMGEGSEITQYGGFSFDAMQSIALTDNVFTPAVPGVDASVSDLTSLHLTSFSVSNDSVSNNLKVTGSYRAEYTSEEGYQTSVRTGTFTGKLSVVGTKLLPQDTPYLSKGVSFFANWVPIAGTPNITATMYFTSQSQGIIPFTNSITSSSVGSFSIRTMAKASSMQRYQERMLKTQNKYPKFIKSNFGFDIRSDIIDEPQYLGGSRGQILFDAVLQTSEGENGGVGSLYGRGVGRTKQRPIKFRCPEHGVIIGLLSVRPRFVYSQGIERAWSRESRFDFYLPDFTDIGMQEIMQKELYATADNDQVPFAYTARYQEYRERFPKICGQFRTIFSDWNMALKFDNPPSLTGGFLSMSSGTSGFKRPFAVPSEHSYLGYLYNRVTAVRPVPKYAKRTKI
ncbi:major capsid protein [Peromfec virus RodF8_37]|uniref:Major capsid protein n=1 Tax=Peromfec virus RodF8_37 TaxID=2929372 RepID=A0A976N2S7_9VIRU|nr:major capsid protein [Peromfec virus RodF8_37]